MNCWGNAYQAEGTASAKSPSRVSWVCLRNCKTRCPARRCAERNEMGSEMEEAARHGAGTVRIWGFVPSKMSCNWRVLYRGVTCFTLDFNRCCVENNYKGQGC